MALDIDIWLYQSIQKQSLNSKVLVEKLSSGSPYNSFVEPLPLNPLPSLIIHCSQSIQRLLSKQDWLLQEEEQKISHVMSPIFFLHSENPSPGTSTVLKAERWPYIYDSFFFPWSEVGAQEQNSSFCSLYQEIPSWIYQVWLFT